MGLVKSPAFPELGFWDLLKGRKKHVLKFSCENLVHRKGCEAGREEPWCTFLSTETVSTQCIYLYSAHLFVRNVI